MSPTISLCLIALDEEKFLPACLESVQGAVDEIVVVDTGSVDYTVDIALKAGARVVNFPWCNDFSAARNAAKASCTGDWILILDADERLAPGAGAKLREAVNNATFDCGYLPLSNSTTLNATPGEVLSGAARNGEPTLLLRLVRNTSNLRWRGAIHENLVHWKQQGNRQSVTIDAPVIHYGYVKEIWCARKKSRRNSDMLKQRCKDEPENPAIWGKLALIQIEEQKFDEARQSADIGWKAMEALLEKKQPMPLIVVLVTVRVQLLFMSGKIADALASIDQVYSWLPVHPNIDLLRGQALCHISSETEDPAACRDYLDQAIVSFNNCLTCANKKFSQMVLQGATSWAAHAWKGHAELLRNHPKSALACFNTALDNNAQYLFARLGRSEALIHTGKSVAATAILESLQQQCRSADASILTAMACENMGQLEKMDDYLQIANEKIKHGLLWQPRGRYLQQLRLAWSIYRGDPQNGPGIIGKLGALIRELPVTPYSPTEPDWLSVHRLVRNLAAINQTDTLKHFLAPGADKTIPGLSVYTRRVISEMQ